MLGLRVLRFSKNFREFRTEEIARAQAAKTNALQDAAAALKPSRPLFSSLKKTAPAFVRWRWMVCMSSNDWKRNSLRAPPASAPMLAKT